LAGDQDAAEEEEAEAVEAETACGMERVGGVDATKGVVGWWWLWRLWECGLDDESSSATLGRVGKAAGWSGVRASGPARGRRQSLAMASRRAA
jgi:hypothetical protein